MHLTMYGNCQWHSASGSDTYQMVEVPNKGSVALFSWFRGAMAMCFLSIHSNATVCKMFENCMHRLKLVF